MNDMYIGIDYLNDIDAIADENAIASNASEHYVISASKSISNPYFSSDQYELQDEYDKIRFLEPIITSEIKESIGNNSFAGIEYSVKSASSINDKILRKCERYKALDKPIPPKTKILSDMSDIIRYTEICPHDEIFKTAKSTIDSLAEKGYIVNEIKNYYIEPYPKTDYMGLHINLISPYGQEIELQIHSEQSFAAKMSGHDLYQKIRAVSSEPHQDKDILLTKIKEIHNSVPMPKDFDAIKSFQLEQQEKQKAIAIGKQNTVVDIESIDISDSTKAIMYHISFKNQPIFEGFEIHFSDGSSWSFNRNLLDNQQMLYKLLPDGELISARKMPEIINQKLSVEYIAKLAQKQEELHKEWIDTHLDNETKHIAVIDLAITEKI